MKPSTIISALFVVVAIVLALGEFLFFDRMTSKHHAWVFPRWNDQSYYLTQAYQGYENVKARGLITGLRETLARPTAQGVMHEVSATLVFWLVGSASRSAALSLNMLAFIAWQLALLLAFRRAGQAWALGWMGFGLLLCIFWPWSAEAGSAIDFRLDHAAMCLFGVCGAFALLTQGWRSTRYSALLGVAIAVTLLERFLTGVYFAALFIASIGWILLGPEKAARLRNLALTGFIVLLLAGPVFWAYRAMIVQYYWVGQVTGAEAAARAPGFDGWQSLKFVATYATQAQLGDLFWRAAGWLTVTLAGLSLLIRFAFRRPLIRIIDWDWLFFGLAFLILPGIVLCLNKQKSHVVLGILAPGFVLLLGWLWAALWPRPVKDPARPGFDWSLLTVAPAVGILLAGGSFFKGRLLWQPHDARFQANAREVNQVTGRMYATIRQAGRTSFRLGVDQVTDFFDPETIRVIGFERGQGDISPQCMLPVGILELSEEFIYRQLKQCDFVMLTDEGGAGTWPYDRQMQRLHPQIKAWCIENMRLREDLVLFNRHLSLYQRRDLP